MTNTLKSLSAIKTILITLALAAAVALTGGSSGFLTGHPIDFDLGTDNYVGTHNFLLTIEGMEGATFNSEFVIVSGVKSTTQQDKKGGLRTRYAPVEMGRVYKGVDDLYGWRREIEEGLMTKRNIQVDMMDSAFRVVRSVTLYNAWPSDWQMPDMDGSSSGPAMEIMTFQADKVVEE